MKFTGIVAALSVAGSVSAAVIPQLPLANALNKLDSVLSNVDGLLGQTLTCVTGNVDLGQVKSGKHLTPSLLWPISSRYSPRR